MIIKYLNDNKSNNLCKQADIYDLFSRTRKLH